MKKISGKVIVITGGSMGFGKAFADRLRADGNTVITLSRKAEDNGEDTFRCDVSNAESVKSVFYGIGSLYKKIDILVNNAGFGQSGAVELIEDRQLEYIVDTNLLGVVYCTKYALPFMEEGAKIINIGSMSAFIPMPFRTMYSAAKSAVNGFSFGMSMELAGTGIGVTSICLGDIRTDFASHRQTHVITDKRYGSRIDDVDKFVSARPMSKKIALGKAVLQVYRIACKRKLYPFYIVGIKYKLAYALSKFVPIKLLMDAVGKSMK